jgi:hypothetical protein
MAKTPTRRRHRWVRRAAITLALVVVVALLVGVFAGPAIIAALAPSLVNGFVPGRIELRDVSLSWRGELNIGHAAIYDPSDAHVATVSARTGGGLLGLLDARLDRDVTVNGWATIEVAEDGSTNLERALGLSKSEPQPSSVPSESEPLDALPFERVVIDRVDVSLARAGSPTLAITGLTGEATATGSRLAASATGALAMPATPPRDRQAIESAPTHGAFDLTADIDLANLAGAASAEFSGITPEAAGALGALSGDDTVAQAAMVAARGGLELNLEAAIEGGMPTAGKVALSSETITANLDFATRDSALQLESPGSVDVDTAAFLANDAIRLRALPGEGVRVSQAGRLSLAIERLRLPLDQDTPRFEAAVAAINLSLGATNLTVPGPDGQPVDLRLDNIAAAIMVAPGAPLTLDASANAAVTGQPQGALSIAAALEPAAAMDAFADIGTLGVAGLTRALPTLNVELRGVPTLAAKPWLAALEGMGLDVPRIVGDTVSATIAWKAAEGDVADISLDIQSPHLRASADARWTVDAVAIAAPATLGIDRPDAIAAPWLPEGWAMQPGAGVRASLSALRLPMDGLRPNLSAATASASVQTSGVQLSAPDLPALGLQHLDLRVDTNAQRTSLQLDAKPTAGGHPATLAANLRTAGLPALLNAGEKDQPAVLGTIDLTAPAELASAFDTTIAGRPLRQWVGEALGPQVTAKLELAQPTDQQRLAGVLSVQAPHANLNASGIALTPDALTIGGATLTATPSQALWQALAPILKLEGATLAQTSPLVVNVGAATFPLGQGASLAAGLQNTSLDLALRQPIRINGVPTGAPDEAGNRPRADVAIPTLTANLESLGALLGGGAQARGALDLAIESPGHGRIAALQGRLAPADSGVVALTVTLDHLDTQRASSIAGLGESAAAAIQGALGATARLELRATARPAAGERPWALQQTSLAIQADRLKTASPIETVWDTDAVTLARPAALTWTPDAHWLESAIGARVTSVEPLNISLDRMVFGNPLAGELSALDPSVATIDAALSGQGATIAIADRPAIEFQTIQARVRRVAQNAFSLTGGAATANGGTLELNGLIENLTDAQGVPRLETATVRGTLKGNDVPVALADAMSNTDGLLADSLGDVVDLDAEVQNGRLVPGQPPQADLRFSVRGPRADASGYGRLADHVISMPEPQTILTVREVRPEIAERFSEIIPELLMVEKRPEDGPAVIRTQGLSIPTNGDWSKGQGKVTVALGTARFRTSSVLSGVLKATGQREQGSLGRRIDPINITMVNGVITYQPFDLPIGDLTLHSEGTVNLPANTMDVLVWIPMAALSDEAAGKFNTGLGSALGRSVPGFGSATTVPWRVSGPLNAPDIRPAPGVLIERRGQQLFGPLLRPGESLQDLLSIPRRREQPEGGG